MISSSAASVFEHLGLLHPGIQVYAGVGNREGRCGNELCVYFTDIHSCERESQH